VLQLIDRRLNGRHKSALNRQRFIRRYKEQIRRAVDENIATRSISDVNSGSEVHIPRRDISEPEFGFGSGGRRDTVHPGNREFVAGDEIERPDSGGGNGGSQAGEDGNGEDDFVFTLTREEFLELFFEGLALPNLQRTQVELMVEEDSVRAGYTRDGMPTSLDVRRSLSGALARRVASRAALACELEQARAERTELATRSPPPSVELEALDTLLADLESRLRGVPFIDQIDLRFHNRVSRPRPRSQAVMFCLMDVSGSMDEKRKDMAKRFFMLLYYFLHTAYDHIQVVFIRHHTQASEVDEETFFSARDSGGTMVSSALELMDEIIRDRYPSDDWNVYTAQASDGDNWPLDGARCRELLATRVLPAVRYYAYVQIEAETEQQLWREYDSLRVANPHFVMQKIRNRNEIYPVFRKLLRKDPV